MSGDVGGIIRRELLDAAPASAPAAHAEHEDGTVALWFVFVALAVGSATRTALHGTSIPYTVVLFMLGMLWAVIYDKADIGLLDTSLAAWKGINPHLLLAVFLPALIFESSFSMEWHTLKKVLPKVLLLAGPGVLISMAITGCLIRAMPFGLSWGFCMMLGSILSATDPVAVVAILKEVGASKVLGHLIEGESLVNDGTAIVVFNVFLAIARGEEKTFGNVMKDLITQPIISALLGGGIGYACLFWLKNSRQDHLVDITITLFAGYISFMLAENVIKCSGVLAVVVLGWVVSAKGRTHFKGHVQHSMHHFWEMLTYAANTIVFILAGFLIVADILVGELEIKWSDLGWGVLLYMALNVVRLITTAMLYPFMNMFKAHKLTVRETAIAVWAGLRGAVGLALALVVVEDDTHFSARQRGLTLALVSCEVCGTLFINATTSATMLRLVGLLTPGLSHDRALAAARKAIHERALQHYDEQLEQTGARYLGAPDFTAVKQLVPFLRQQIGEETEIEFKMEIAKMDAQLMAEMRCRFLHGLTTEIWKMLEDDLIDSMVASALLIAIERARDKASSMSLCDLIEFNKFMKMNRVKLRVVKWFDRSKFRKKILDTLRYLKLIDQAWMATRRQMQGLHALISAHRLTSEQFKALLGENTQKNEDEALSEEAKIGSQETPSIAVLAREFTIKKAIEQPNANLTNETSLKSNHVRDVLEESNIEVAQAVEMLKEMQLSHNAVARSLRSEALAREILEVTMIETKLLTHTGLLDESEGSMLQAEHDAYLRRIIRHPLPPSRTSPGRILAAVPLFDFTQRVGIKSRELRKKYLRETDVLEFKPGDVILDPSERLHDGILVVGNGVVCLSDSNNPESCMTMGCKSHPFAWALALYECLANWHHVGEEPLRSGLRAIAQANMYGFVVPKSLLDSLHADLRESETLEYMWRTVVGVFAETIFVKGLHDTLPGVTSANIVRAGKLIKVSKGTKLEHHERQVVILLEGTLYNESVGEVMAPCVVTFKKCDMRGATKGANELEHKLESRLGALKFGKNGLVRGSSSNLMALSTIQETQSARSISGTEKPATDDDVICGFESMTDLLLFVVPSKDKFIERSQMGTFKRTSAKSAKKEAFLRTLTKNLHSSTVSPATRRSEREKREHNLDDSAGLSKALEFDIESGKKSESTQRCFSMQLERRTATTDDPAAEDPRTQLTSDSLPSMASDDANQATIASDDIGPLRGGWDGSSPLGARALSSRDYDDPSTQHTIS